MISDSFLNELSKPQPDPGRGAAAAHGALIGLALIEKIVLLEWARAGEDDLVFHSREKDSALIDSLFYQMESLREKDRKIYPEMVRLRTSGTQGPAYLRVVETSIAVPLQIMKKSLEGLTLVAEMKTRIQKVLKADLWVSAELLGAALRGAFHIGRSNLPLTRGLAFERFFEKEFIEVLEEGEGLMGRIKKDFYLASEGIDQG